MKRIILSGGGTGGHIFPAIAIADRLKATLPEAELLFVGAERGMEIRLVQNAGYKIETVAISGFYRKLSLDNISRNLKLPYKIWKSRKQATSILRSFQPDACIGTGGFASYPLLRAAQGLGIFTAIQEQNALPGLANRRLSAKANLVLLGNPDARSRFPPRTETLFTGNPVRETLTQTTRGEALARYGLSPGRPTMLVTGGSLGSRTLNMALEQGLPKLAAAGIQVLWQCGMYYHLDLEQRLGRLPQGMWLLAFIDDMASAYAAADLVVCRAGALTISELVALQKPAILVPSPNVANNHQTANARSLSARKAAVLMRDEDARHNLVPAALDLLSESPKMAEIVQALQQMTKPGGTQAIIDAVIAKFRSDNKTA